VPWPSWRRRSSHLLAAPRLFDLMGSTRFWSLGQREEAVTHTARASLSIPSSFYPYVNLCDINLDAGKIDEARRVVADGLTHVPQDIRLRAKEAQVLLREKRHQEAIGTNRASLQPFIPTASLRLLSWPSAYNAAGDWAQAESVYAAAVKPVAAEHAGPECRGWAPSRAGTTRRRTTSSAEPSPSIPMPIGLVRIWPVHWLNSDVRKEAEAILLEMEGIWPKEAESARALGDSTPLKPRDFSRAKMWASGR